MMVKERIIVPDAVAVKEQIVVPEAVAVKETVSVPAIVQKPKFIPDPSWGNLDECPGNDIWFVVTDDKPTTFEYFCAVLLF